MDQSGGQRRKNNLPPLVLEAMLSILFCFLLRCSSLLWFLTLSPTPPRSPPPTRPSRPPPPSPRPGSPIPPPPGESARDHKHQHHCGQEKNINIKPTSNSTSCLLPPLVASLTCALPPPTPSHPLACGRSGASLDKLLFERNENCQIFLNSTISGFS